MRPCITVYTNKYHRRLGAKGTPCGCGQAAQFITKRRRDNDDYARNAPHLSQIGIPPILRTLIIEPQDSRGIYAHFFTFQISVCQCSELRGKLDPALAASVRRSESDKTARTEKYALADSIRQIAAIDAKLHVSSAKLKCVT